MTTPTELDETMLPAGPLALGEVVLRRAGRQRNWHANPDCRTLRTAMQRPGTEVSTMVVTVTGETVADALAGTDTLAVHGLHCTPVSPEADAYLAAARGIIRDRGVVNERLALAQSVQAATTGADDAPALNWIAVLADYADRWRSTKYLTVTALPEPLAPYGAEIADAEQAATSAILASLSGKVFGPDAVSPAPMRQIAAQVIYDSYDRYTYHHDSTTYGAFAQVAVDAAETTLRRIAEEDPDFFRAATDGKGRDHDFFAATHQHIAPMTAPASQRPLPMLFLEHAAGEAPTYESPDAWLYLGVTGRRSWHAPWIENEATLRLHAELMLTALDAMEEALTAWITRHSRAVVLLWNSYAGHDLDRILEIQATPVVPIPAITEYDIRYNRDGKMRMAVVPEALALLASESRVNGDAVYYQPLPDGAPTTVSTEETETLARALLNRRARVRQYGYPDALDAVAATFRR